MPVVTSHAQGTPSWIDLSTTDPAAAQAFYGPLFGWSFEVNPTDQGDEYIMASLNGSSAAGMMQQMAEQAAMGLPSLWNTYFTVDDIGATVGKVEGAGGSVMMPPMQVMDAGHLAVIVDPTGAVACLWQPGQHIGCEIVNEPGALIWNELVSTDSQAALQFYNDIHGTTTIEEDMGMEEPYRMLVVGENPVAGAMAPPMEGIPNHWSIYFNVANLDETLSLAAELGGAVVVPAFDVPGVWRMAGLTDPTGAMFMLMQSEAPAA
jgi:predicted enzyme related to lactoylglutathione lyase